MSGLRARAVATNDGESDDMNSFLHLLLCANDIDIEGLVYSSSVHHYAGDEKKGITSKRWENPKWMWCYLDAYAEVYPNLVKHDPRYPDPDYLRSVTCIGNVAYPGEMERDTPGSNLIVDAVLKEDDRPVYLLAGGGTNTIARALKHIEERYRGSDEWERVYRHVCNHAVIYTILLQDDTYRDYISQVWPDIRLLHADTIDCVGFSYSEWNSPADALRVYGAPWMQKHIAAKGSLGSLYHTWLDGHYYEGDTPINQFGTNEDLARNGNIWLHMSHEKHQALSEGDSPNFLFLIEKGLRSLENPGNGSWGGRFEKVVSGGFNPKADYWVTSSDYDGGMIQPKQYQLSRWISDWMNDFACRLSWALTPDYAAANHPPAVSIVEGVDISICAGGEVVLHADASDPDGDDLHYEWFSYGDAGTCQGGVEISASGATAVIRVPGQAQKGDIAHVILKVRDRDYKSDEAYMVTYQHAIITIE